MTAKISYNNDRIETIELNGTVLGKDQGVWWLADGEGEDCRVYALQDQFGNLSRDLFTFAQALGDTLGNRERGYAYVSQAIGVPLKVDVFGEELLAIAAQDAKAAAEYDRARFEEDKALARAEIALALDELHDWEGAPLDPDAFYAGIQTVDVANLWSL